MGCVPPGLTVVIVVLVDHDGLETFTAFAPCKVDVGRQSETSERSHCDQRIWGGGAQGNFGSILQQSIDCCGVIQQHGKTTGGSDEARGRPEQCRRVARMNPEGTGARDPAATP